MRIPNNAALMAITLLAAVTAAAPALCQNTTADRPPIIDTHVHALDGAGRAGVPMCVNPSGFTASDPDTDEASNGWSKEECSPKIFPVEGEAYMRQVLAEMDRLNVTAVIFGDPAVLKTWKAAAPQRIILGTAFAPTTDPAKQTPIEQLRKTFTQDGFQVMGEIGLQYEGLSPSDPAFDKYFALAEELDIPVAIHMGTGGSGRANLKTPKFRGSMGDPLLLEKMLARHPKLRVQVMHAGYPMIDNMLTLLQANSHVSVDVAGLVWSYPLVEVNGYIKRLVQAGFGDRVMFGSDQLARPGLMAHSISVIQNADYLTPEQKRDILYNNAARFYRIGVAPKRK
jgi:predicted TIM-barrel fold metal-dependent hydrolase